MIDQGVEMAEARKFLAERDALYRANPLAFWHLPAEDFDPPDMRHANPTQLVFHKSQAKSRWLISGNTMGKTVAVAHEIAYWLAHCHPFRKTPDGPIMVRWYCVDKVKIEEILLPRLISCLPPSIVDHRRGRIGYNSQTGILAVRCKFGGWHQVFMGTYGQEAMATEGGQFHLLGYDEPPPFMLYDANQIRRVEFGADEIAALTPLQDEIPYDVSWISTDIEAKADGKNIAVFRIPAGENLKHLDREMYNDVVARYSEEQKAVRVRGEFSFLKGVIYKEFKTDTHLCEPFDVRQRVADGRGLVYVGIDHGDYKNTAATFHYVQGEGDNLRGWIFGEYFDGQGRRVDQNCHEIKALLGDLPIEGWFCDPRTFHDEPNTGTTMAEKYFAAGCPIIQSDDDVTKGEESVKQMLAVPRNEAGQCWRDNPDVMPPRLMVFNVGCEQTVKALQLYSTKPVRSRVDDPAEIVRSNRHKHLPDSIRYLYAMEPSGPSVRRAARPVLDLRTAMPMQMIAQSKQYPSGPSRLAARIRVPSRMVTLRSVGSG